MLLFGSNQTGCEYKIKPGFIYQITIMLCFLCNEDILSAMRIFSRQSEEMITH